MLSKDHKNVFEITFSIMNFLIALLVKNEYQELLNKYKKLPIYNIID